MVTGDTLAQVKRQEMFVNKIPNTGLQRRLLRLKPAAAYLSISPGLLRALVQRGEIPVIKITESGHAPWLLDRHELDNWIERTKVTL